MKEYIIHFVETNRGFAVVEAESAGHAEDMAMEAYADNVRWVDSEVSGIEASEATGLACRRCGSPAWVSDNPEYSYQCPVCDEDLYGFEVEDAAERDEDMGDGKVFEMLEHLGVVSTYPTGWTRELNLVSWNGGNPKFDIRDWAPGHEHMSRGVTLRTDEAKSLKTLLDRALDEKEEHGSDEGGNAGGSSTAFGRSP